MKVHPHTLEFLKAINEHNSRTFFASVRDLYDEIWENINEVAAGLINEMSKIDSDYADLQPKECLFRIYRDARRIKDGDPIYKNNFGMAIWPGGKKSSLPGYYLHIQWGNKSFFGGGVYRPTNEELFNLRSYIKSHGKEYKKLANNKEFKKIFGEVEGKDSIRVPVWFKADDANIDIIMKKQHLFFAPISDKDLLNKDIIELCMERVHASKELMDFLTTGCTTKAKK